MAKRRPEQQKWIEEKEMHALLHEIANAQMNDNKKNQDRIRTIGTDEEKAYATVRLFVWVSFLSFSLVSELNMQ